MSESHQADNLCLRAQLENLESAHHGLMQQAESRTRLEVALSRADT